MPARAAVIKQLYTPRTHLQLDVFRLGKVRRAVLVLKSQDELKPNKGKNGHPD